MSHAEAMRRCLEDGDVAGARALWAQVAPGMPQPKTEAEATVVLHMARTQSELVTLRARAWSHRWLLDHGKPSLLPDSLKPKAERIYPKIAEGVGLAVGTKSELGRAIKPHVVGAMNYAINECYADARVPNPVTVKARMFEAKDRIIKKLIGIVGRGLS
jgi:hypothetical protein